MDRDLEHLRLLSIFHYVVSGFSFLFSLFPVIYLFLGIGLITGILPETAETPNLGDAQFVGWIMVGVAVCMLLLGLGFATCLALAGKFLAAKRHYTFCIIVAVLSCFCMPFGTILGVFTLVVLTRESVKGLFRSPQAAGSGA